MIRLKTNINVTSICRMATNVLHMQEENDTCNVTTTTKMYTTTKVLHNSALRQIYVRRKSLQGIRTSFPSHFTRKLNDKPTAKKLDTIFTTE